MASCVKTVVEPEYVRVSWSGSEVWNPDAVEFQNPVERIAHQQVHELILDEVLVELEPGVWRLEFDSLWDLGDLDRELLHIPAPDRFAAQVYTLPHEDGSRRRVLGLDLRHDVHGVLNDCARRGPFVELEGGANLLLPRELSALEEHLARGHEGNERESAVATQQAYFAKSKTLAAAANATIESWLEREQYVSADSIGIRMEGGLESGIDLIPEATGVDSPEVQALVATSDGRHSVIWAAQGRSRKRLVLETDQKRALSELHRRGGHVASEEVPDFLDNPEAFLPPEIDLSEFSDRVKGLKIRVYDSTPYVSVRKEKLKWFPDISIDMAPVDPETGPESGGGPGESKEPPLSSEEYLQRVREARKAGKDYFVRDGAVVRFDPNAVDPVLNLEDRLGPSMNTGVEGSRAYMLEIFENVDALEYSIVGEDDADGESLPDREVLEFEVPDRLDATLHPFQRTGYCWLRTLDTRHRGGLLADDMGLGKTIQVISYLAAICDENRPGPTLVVAPKTLIENWIEEVARFCPTLRVGQYKGGVLKGTAVLEAVDIVLTTYDALRIHALELGRVDWGVVVCDEAQAIKNPTTGRTKAVKALKAPMRIAMTGTPVENGLSELWSIMDWVQPGLLRSRDEFRREHERVIVAADSEEDRGREIRKLQERILNHYLRRMKTEVLEGLPEKRVHRVERALSPEQVSEYLGAVKSAQGGGRGAMLSCLQHLLRLSACPWEDAEAYAVSGSSGELSKCPKLASTVEILDRVHEADEKALVFVERLAVQGMLQAMIASRYGIHADLINGKVTSGRQSIVNQFNKRPGFQVMILSPRVGGTGLNITSANHVIHYMRPWNPAIENQATDRAHRIGQEKEVNVYLPIATWPDDSARSVDQVLDDLIQSKMNLATDVIIPTARMSLDTEVMGRIFGAPVEAR